jgi:hypothetical protein
MEPPATWTTFAIASEDLSGQVLGRTDGGTPLSVGDIIGLAGPNGARRYRVERVLYLIQCYPDRWSNRLVLVEPV